MRNRTTMVVALIGALAVALSGCTSGNDATPPSSTDPLATISPGGSLVPTTPIASPSSSGGGSGGVSGSVTSSAPVTISKTVTSGSPGSTGSTSGSPTAPSTSTGSSAPPKTGPSTKTGADGTPTKSGAVSPQEAADRKAVEAAWLKYWDVYTNMMDVPKDKRRQVYGAIMVDPQLNKIIQSAEYGDKNNLANFGTVEHRISWPSPVDIKNTRLLNDCVDESQFGTIDRKTQTPLTHGPDSVNMQITFVSIQGAWKVAGIVRRAESC